MAYQNVGVPRFYINDFSYANSIGFDANVDTSYQYEAENKNKLINGKINDTSTITNGITTYTYKLPKRNNDFPFNYIAFLNHNFADSSKYFIVKKLTPNQSHNGYADYTEILNANINTGTFTTGQPLNNGCSIYGLDPNTTDLTVEDDDKYILRIQFHNSGGNNIPLIIGNMYIGRYFDMPQSPDLDVLMKIENDGFDYLETTSGGYIRKVSYNGNPSWVREGVEYPSWTVGDGANIIKRRGRRTWKIKFSYLSSQDLFSSNLLGNYNKIDSSDYSANDILETDSGFINYHNIFDDNSFFSQVVNTVGSGKRFIFQPDNTNNNPDQFANCVFDSKNMKFKRITKDLYDITLSIKEVW